MTQMEYYSNCLECKAKLPKEKVRKHAKFCSKECGRIHHHRKYIARRDSTTSGFSSSAIGAINELKASVDLLARGFSVFKNLCPTGPCDLALLIDSKLIRVEVTTGCYNPSGSLSYPPHKIENRDLLAIVLPDKIVYIPSLESLTQN